jgi:hypothetical protein
MRWAPLVAIPTALTRFIGIVGGNPGTSVGGIPYNRGIYPGGGYQANFGRIYHNDPGGNGAYDGGPDH